MTTFARSKAPNSAHSIFSPEGTHANRSASPATEQVKPTNDTSGQKCIASFATYDPDSCSWRTSQGTFPWGSDEFLETWPRSGMTRNGVAYQQPPLVPLTDVIASSSWPTPRANTAMSAIITPESAHNPARFPNLETVVGRRTWPTPNSDDTRPRNQPSSDQKRQTRLSDSVRDQERNNGRLNPQWVAWLMGFPITWTSLEPSEMP